MSKLFSLTIYSCLLALLASYGCSTQTLSSKENKPQHSSGNDSSKADELLVVDCLLPGQIRKLGTSHTFISPRQPIRTTAIDCGIRGGEYVSYDRADYRTALNVWLDSAKQGDAESQVYVGEIFEKGLGTVPDYTQAAAWYRKAAVQGNSRGAINLGYMYEKGLGVQKDTIEALNWYRKASGLEDDDLQFASTIETVNEVQLGQLRQELSLSQGELQSVRTRLRNKEQQIQREQTALNSSEQSLEELKRELDKRRNLTAGSGSGEIIVLQTELQEQQSRVARQREENTALKSRLEQQQGRFDQELAGTRQQQQQLEQDMTAQQRAALDKLSAELSNSRQQLAVAEQQLNAANSQLLAEQNKTSLAHQELASTTSEKQNTAQQLQGEIERREADIQQLQTDQTRELEKAGAINQTLQQKLELQNMELNKLSEELGSSRQQLAVTEQQLNATNSQLLAEQNKTSQAHQELVSTASDKLNTVQHLQGRIERREADIQQLQADQTRELEKAGSLNQTLQQDLAQQNIELQSLRDELSSTRQQHATSEEQFIALNTQLKSEQARSNQTQQQLTSSTAEKQHLIQQLQDEIKQQEAGMTQLQASLNREQEKSGSLEQQLQQDQAQQHQQTASLSSQYNQSQQNLAAAETRLANLEKQLADEQNKSTQAQQALAESSSSNSTEIQRLETEVTRREAELDAQRGQIANLQSEMSGYKGKLQNIQEANNKVALQGPSIEILDPPVTLTRGVPSVQLRSVMKERTIVGMVNAPSGLLTLSVNDRSQTPDEFGIFRTQIPVEDRQTLVNVVAVDKQGKSAAVNFELIPKLRLASAPPQAIERPTPTQSLRRYPVDFGNYYALIIGNNNYANFPNLNSAVNDARTADKILREKYGFKTTLILDADRYSVLSNLNRLREELTEEDNLLIYYAGHGELDQVNLRGHWLPVDAEPNSTANWISNVDVTDILNAISARHILVVADSCYSGTMTRSSLARLESGMSDETRLKWFKVMAKTRSRSALTSGGLKPVLDSGGGDHSVFANAFFQVLRENDDVLEGYKVYRQVSDQVRVAAAKYNLEQIPQYAPIRHGGHEAGEFFFVPSNVRTSDTTTQLLKMAHQSTP